MPACSVGVPGFEPGTSAPQTQRASQLRHTPNNETQYNVSPAKNQVFTEQSFAG